MHAHLKTHARTTLPARLPACTPARLPARLLSSLLAAMVALAACKEAPPASAPEPAAPILQDRQLRFPTNHPQLALLETAPATAGTSVALELPARLVWNEERTQRVYPAFAGRVTAITSDIGQTVQPGGTLAMLASPDYGAAQADAAKARADADFTRKVAARQHELLEAGVAARKDAEQADADVARAQAELSRTTARVSLYGAAAGVDQKLALRASLGGIVVERNLNPGQEVRPDQAGPGVPALFVVSDPGSLWVQIDAREADAASMQRGAIFVLEAPTLPGLRFEGRVTAVSDAIDPSTRTIKVRGVVANPKRQLRAEMLATARFERSLGSGVMVPSSAVWLIGKQHGVFVQSAPGVFEPRDVGVGWQGPQQVLVASGLEVGELVVSGNTLLLGRMYRQAQEDNRVVRAAATAASGAPPGVASAAGSAAARGAPQ